MAGKERLPLHQQIGPTQMGKVFPPDYPLAFNQLSSAHPHNSLGIPTILSANAGLDLDALEDCRTFKSCRQAQKEILKTKTTKNAYTVSS